MEGFMNNNIKQPFQQPLCLKGGGFNGNCI